jgi:hypothetical protein
MLITSRGCAEMFIDKITTTEKQLLIIKSERTTKSYEWVSEAWEPIEILDVDSIILSGNTHVQGILLND